MKLAVVGLWHLGCVTAASLSKLGHEVIAYDSNKELIANLKKNIPPIFEPGLDELLFEIDDKNKISFTHDLDDLNDVDTVWITLDTPLDANDQADIANIIDTTKVVMKTVLPDSLIIVSSQVPAGTCQRLQKSAPGKTTVCYIPENLRLGSAIQIFMQPDRIVIGLDQLDKKAKLESLLSPITDNLLWMSVISAEMTKHAINTFLSVSVTLINEIAALCEAVGANARDVEKGLKSEMRIGNKAYVRPGSAIAGGTLMRDVHFLKTLSDQHHFEHDLLNSIISSNENHKQWTSKKLLAAFAPLAGKKIAMLGLTYKVGTDTLRRSQSIELCEWLASEGAIVSAYDPYVANLPEEMKAFIALKPDVQMAIKNVDAIIISTDHQQFVNLTAEELCAIIKKPFVIDASGFTEKNLRKDERIKYLSVGVPL